MSEYKSTRISRGNGSDLSFDGRLVAEVSSDPSQVTDRWTELRLYETEKGKFVPQSVGRSALPGEGDISNCAVCENLEEVAKFFTVKGKITWLSTAMYAKITKAYPMFDKVERVG